MLAGRESCGDDADEARGACSVDSAAAGAVEVELKREENSTADEERFMCGRNYRLKSGEVSAIMCAGSASEGQINWS